MKKRKFVKGIWVIFLLSLFVISCEENKPKGDEFSWSPDGKKLAMISVESQELLIVDIDTEHIQKISRVDKYSGEKAKIYEPVWSPDGKYLLYSKSSKKALDIFVYSLSESTKTKIDHLPIKEDENFKEKAFPSWSPKINQVLWVAWNDLANNQLFSCLPDGTNKRMLIRLISGKIFPRWSPDGEWIAYSLDEQEGSRENGLWKMDADGNSNSQIFKADRITQFQWSPDGASIAVVRKVDKKLDSGEKQEFYDLSIIDPNGENEKLISEEKSEILELDWSPDGRQLAFVSNQGDSKDLWVVNMYSLKKTKLSFAPVKENCGWTPSGQNIYTIKYPEELITELKEEETREIFESLRGVMKENMLIRNDNFMQQRIDKNIYSYATNHQNEAAAYFKPNEVNFLNSEIYYPVIQFSNGNKLYPARTGGEHISAADELHAHQNYARSLNHLNQYWKVDLRSSDLTSEFDFDLMMKKMEADRDSSHYNRMLIGLKDGTLLKTVMILRKIGYAENSEWLFEQIKKFILYNAEKEEDKDNLFDEIFWSIIGAYSRYHEFEAGIADLDQFLEIPDLDSAFIAYAYFSQSLLALEDEQYERGMEKIRSTIKYLPKEMAELDDMKDLLSIHQMKAKPGNSDILASTLAIMIQRFPENKNVSEIYEMLGDLYLKSGNREKAREAYQNAAALQFDDYEIWDKILSIK